MWEELLEAISNRETYAESPLDCLQRTAVGYVREDTGWDLSLINPWFADRGYAFVGYLSHFNESEPRGVYVVVDSLVWKSDTNVRDSSMAWYFEPCTEESGNSIDELQSLHGDAKQFIWDGYACHVLELAE